MTGHMAGRHGTVEEAESSTSESASRRGVGWSGASMSESTTESGDFGF